LDVDSKVFNNFATAASSCIPPRVEKTVFSCDDGLIFWNILSDLLRVNRRNFWEKLPETGLEPVQPFQAEGF
jgi:hypothetical protein